MLELRQSNNCESHCKNIIVRSNKNNNNNNTSRCIRSNNENKKNNKAKRSTYCSITTSQCTYMTTISEESALSWKLHCDATPTHHFNAKYRRKHIVLLLATYFLLFHNCFSGLDRAAAYNCTQHNGRCQNDGQCQDDGQCLCAEGWQGPECQFCGGKVRLHEPNGTIHDGLGNYSISVKCSWLIDARPQHGNRRPSRMPTIRIHLHEFATECGWDHLYVFDGDSVDSPLLAVYSGLMYRGNFSIRSVPQVIARSGTALLHFFSDDAYNMSGFNLSYKMDGCPTNSESVECSGHGKCNDGDCICDRFYRGEACNIAACPNHCSESKGQGICKADEQKCVCNEGYGGDDCSQLRAYGLWTSIYAKDSPPPPGTASHASAVWRDTMHIIGGESYGRGELMTTYDFNGNVWETLHVEDGNSVPGKRYGVSSVMYGDKIFMYGGVVKGKGISNELWAFDVSAKTWENITVKSEACNITAMPFAMCGPLHVAGHTATLVPRSGDTYQYMVVIFGHSPQFGYLNTVQEFNFATREWKIVETHGYVVKGGFGHSAAYDNLTEKVYVYGGLISESESSQVLSAKLYAYEPATRIWTLLSAAPSARLLHTANFINQGLMMVFGGNTHNDTSQSYGAKCYSQDLLVYDVFCDSWHMQDMPSHLQADLARFGHSSAVFENSLYIYGGFNGQLLNDMLRYTPGHCRYFTKQEKCTNARPGVKCIWDVQKMICIPISQVQHSAIFGREQYDYVACPSKSRLTMTSEHLNDVSRCQELNNCQSCLSNTFGCTYCGNSICTKDRCRETTSVTSVFYESTLTVPALPNIPPLNIKSLEHCPSTEEYLAISICDQLHSCRACASNPSCNWEPANKLCKPFISLLGHNNRTADDIMCGLSCAALATCHNCTEGECIWCQNEQRCVDRNAYVASFPYGQCREWTTHSDKCRSTPSNYSGTSISTTTALSSAQCGFYNSCAQCLDDPACGWCDDGSNTGLGKCIVGGAQAPYDSNECEEKNWSFTSCPRCNCNGHSHCYGPEYTHCEQPCSNLTYGFHCEKCRIGYWGNPINGGNCQKCDCNNQGDYCDPVTGKCFCNTKGIVGDHCEKCDSQNHYHGDPIKSSCYYELTIDYQFTFNLSKKEDRHFTQINFRNSPVKSEIDADLTITCSVPAKMDINVKRAGSPEKPIFEGINCSTFRHRFPKMEYNFGHSPEDNSSLTTFYVYVHDFQPPIWIQIAFSQYPKLNLQQFFITFSTCFLLLLLIAAVMWKIKQKYDMFRRRQRLFVEMEQMASRPFSQVLVEIENRDSIDLTNALAGKSNMSRKRKKECPSPIALEPCSGNRAAVLSLLVRLPTGGLSHAPAGQSAGLAVASALVTLGNQPSNRPSIEYPDKPKSKRKQSQHPDTCT